MGKPIIARPDRPLLIVENCLGDECAGAETSGEMRWYRENVPFRPHVG